MWPSHQRVKTAVSLKSKENHISSVKKNVCPVVTVWALLGLGLVFLRTAKKIKYSPSEALEWQ